MLTASQAFYLMVKKTGRSDFIEYDQFQIWWNSRGKALLAKSISEITRSNDTRLTKSGYTTGRFGREWKEGFQNRQKEVNPNTIAGRLGQEIKKAMRLRKKGDIRSAKNTFNWIKKAERLSNQRRSGVGKGVSDAEKYRDSRKRINDDEKDEIDLPDLASGVPSWLIAVIIGVSLGATIPDLVQQIVDSMSDEDLNSARYALVSGGGGMGGGSWQ